MATFIKEVALRIYDKYGDELSSLNVVLPSKRARLFLAEALSKVAVRPIWEPNYTSIDDLMCRMSGLRKADRLRLVAELHKVYSNYHEGEFDEFYHWGEVLVSDFDMVDKYMVDASQLFANIGDLKELEADMSYLSAEQIAMINRFWRTITGDSKGVVEESFFEGLAFAGCYLRGVSLSSAGFGCGVYRHDISRGGRVFGAWRGGVAKWREIPLCRL